MVTMATELFCLNKLLKSLRYFHVVFLSVVLRVKIFNLTIQLAFSRPIRFTKLISTDQSRLF
jgi:hypothetical protein